MFFFAEKPDFWAKFGLKYRVKSFYLYAILKIARSKNEQISPAERKKGPKNGQKYGLLTSRISKPKAFRGRFVRPTGVLISVQTGGIP